MVDICGRSRAEVARGHAMEWAVGEGEVSALNGEKKRIMG